MPYICKCCGEPCETTGEEMAVVTVDMAGAELRIIAELANDPIWIGAFDRGEDVHSVGTEILYAEEWPKLMLPSIAHPERWSLQDSKNEVVLIIIDKDGKEQKIGPCAYYATKDNGEIARRKCKCPEHVELRDATKAVNFLLAYGGGPGKLSKSIKKTLEEAKALMAIHERKFPNIWAYLEKSGRSAKALKKSFDMFGRRRLFPEPTNERAKQRMISDNADKLKLKDDEIEKNIATWRTLHNNEEPKGDVLWSLTHRMPSQKEISKTYMAMSEGIGRQGKNHCIQGTNATVAKVAAGSGTDPNGKPFLWHILPQYRARFIKFVHDELVISCPKRYAEQVATEVQDAFRRAAALRMTRVTMESEYNVASYWSK